MNTGILCFGFCFELLQLLQKKYALITGTISEKN